MDVNACNYDNTATCDDGNCTYPPTATETATSCDSYVWSMNGTTYTSSGTYTHVASGPCPTTTTLTLTINSATSNIDTRTECGAYTWPLNGITYTSSGVYTFVSTNSNGCVHTETLNLTIQPAGCMDTTASNYNSAATCDDGSCSYINYLTYVPDDNFENFLESGDPAINGRDFMGNGIANDDYVFTANIDTVPDFRFSGYNPNRLSYLNISDLTGIEDFAALTELHARNNNITNLGIQTDPLSPVFGLPYLSNNTALTELSLRDNPLTTLDISYNTALTHIFIGWTDLTTLDLSNNIALTHIYGEYNKLTSLDLSNNPALQTVFGTYASSALEEVDLRSGGNTNMLLGHPMINNQDSPQGLVQTYATVYVDNVPYANQKFTQFDPGVIFGCGPGVVGGCTDTGSMPATYYNNAGGTGSVTSGTQATNYDNTATCDDGNCTY